MEALGQLAGRIAHDFNNVLTAICGFAEVLENALAPRDPLRGHAAEILTAGERAASLIRQLLAFSRAQPLEPEVLDLNVAVATMDQLFRRVIGEDIDLVTVVAPTLGHVIADPGQIDQVLMNLVVNARDAMPQGGKLTIETANVELDEAAAHERPTMRPGSYVRLAVSDTGIGMDGETQRRIFEPFFTTKAQGKGTGLGLATVYGIVKQSGREISVYSEPGRGTTFTIYLPRVGQAAAPAPSSPPAREAAGGGETILLLDDDAQIRALLGETLGVSGYTVLAASHGEEALRIGTEHLGPIHLLVTDVVMPGMSGPEVAQRMAAVRPGIPVLYVSGYAEHAMVHHDRLPPGGRRPPEALHPRGAHAENAPTARWPR